MNFAVFGPTSLGRGAIITPGQEIPEPVASAPVFDIDQSVVDKPSDVVKQLHQHWVRREPVVLRLHVDVNVLKAFTQLSDTREPWEVGHGFLFDQQRLHFLTWNNNVDCRSGEPIWWWTNKAVSLGATRCESSEADIVLADGTLAFCDGGPTQPLQVPHALIPYISIENRSLRPINNISSTSDLAVDQAEAVNHRGGATRIIAPAGSGKTRVLTERLRHLLNDWNIEPSAVTALAYNTRAAGEMKERTSGLPTNIRTLNAIGLAIVNGTGGFAKSSIEARPRTMLEEREVRNILQSMVTVSRRFNTDPLAPWIEALSLARLGLQSPRLIEESNGDVSEFAEVFDKYRSYLTSHNLLDFDEQIYRAIEILMQDPIARDAAQRRCRLLLVDEFQDLTPAHMLLLRLLASPGLDVFGVGDDDQVIYGYAGADPRYLVEFDSWFPGAIHHALEINYRCPVKVVEAASNMLTRNGLRVAKSIHPAPNKTENTGEFIVAPVAPAEMATNAVDAVSKWLEAGVSAEEVAVLSRVNVALLPVQILLTEAGIPHTAPVSSSLLDRTGIRTAFAYLRIALDPDSIQRSDILETVRRPSRKIARNVVEMMTKRSRTSLDDLTRLSSALTGNDGARVEHYTEDLEMVIDAVESGNTAKALDAIRTKVGLGEAMDVLDSSRKEADRSTHSDDLAALIAVAHMHPDVATFEPWIRSALTGNRNDEGVELSTVHRVKGREWDNVIVYDASLGLVPHRLSTDRAEERRVFHVAITRARQQAVVLANAEAPSPFLLELDAPGEPEVIVRTVSTSSKTNTAKTPASTPAVIGLQVSIPGGIDGEIIDLTDSGAVVGMGRARTTVEFGSSVKIRGKLVELGKPLDQNTQSVLDALKEWRRNTASEVKLPAYTVLHDSHLEAIAAAAPSSLVELSKCNGIGPAKLERWGDEILSVISEATKATNSLI